MAREDGRGSDEEPDRQSNHPANSILADFSEVDKRLQEIGKSRGIDGKPKVLVLGAVSGLGHLIEALSVGYWLKQKDYEVEVRNFSDRDVAGRLVNFLWEGLTAKTYEFMQRKGLVDKANAGGGLIAKLEDMATKRLSGKLYDYATKGHDGRGFDVVITTHPTPAKALWHARERQPKGASGKDSEEAPKPYIINWVPDMVPEEIGWFYASPADETWVVDKSSMAVLEEALEEYWAKGKTKTNNGLAENHKFMVMGHPGPPTLNNRDFFKDRVRLVKKPMKNGPHGKVYYNFNTSIPENPWMARTGGAGTNHKEMEEVLEEAVEQGQNLIVLVNHHQGMAKRFAKYLNRRGLKDDEYEILFDDPLHKERKYKPIGAVMEYRYNSGGNQGKVWVVYATGEGIEKRMNAAKLNILLMAYPQLLFTKPGEQAMYETGERPWLCLFPSTNPQERVMMEYATGKEYATTFDSFRQNPGKA